MNVWKHIRSFYWSTRFSCAAPSQEGAELALVVFDTFGSCSLRNELQSYLLPSFFLFICCTARQSLIFFYLFLKNNLRTYHYMYNLNQYVITIFIGIAKIIIMAAIIIMIVKMCLWQDILIYNFCYDKIFIFMHSQGDCRYFFSSKFDHSFMLGIMDQEPEIFCQIMIYILGP